MGAVLGGWPRAGLCRGIARDARRIQRAAARPRPHAQRRTARASRYPPEALRRPVRFAGAAMNERSAFDDSITPGDRAESPPEGYAGRPRDAQLEYKAILANVSIGIAFTRDRRFTLCNPKFADILGWQAEELIGQPGEVVYPSRESY